MDWDNGKKNGGEDVKKFGKILIFVAILLLLAALAIGHFSMQYYHETYITIDGILIRRDITRMDFSGAPVEQWERLTELTGLTQLDLSGTGLTSAQYDALQEALPQCRIQWDVLFQGQYLPCDTQSLTLTRLTDQDVAKLDYFADLRTVKATDCPDLDQLLELQRRHPTCKVTYQVTLAGENWNQDADYLILADADTASIQQMLTYLPKVERILLTEPLPPMSDIEALRRQFPAITITYLVDIHGYAATEDAVTMELSDIVMEDSAALERALTYLPNVEKVIMCNCGLSNEDMDALCKAYSDIRFIWTVEVGPFRLRTDTTGFIPIKYGYWLNDEECYNLRYCTDMVALDLGHCYITNCDFVEFMPDLKYLILADTDVRDISPIANHEKLIYLELFLAPVYDYTPLLSCPNLEDLNICYTYGQLHVLTQMPQLKRLWWGPNRQEIYGYLQYYLPNTYLELALNSGSSTGDGWREGQHYYDQRDYLGMYYMYG